MARCGRSRVSAHPASGSFCSPQVKLTVPARAVSGQGQALREALQRPRSHVPVDVFYERKKTGTGKQPQ
jgi:putative SOS response-associated peptidase YedK